ncbi:hypothetical protein Hanom_Chr04g00349541 [Helianthus anomalus]
MPTVKRGSTSFSFLTMKQKNIPLINGELQKAQQKHIEKKQGQVCIRFLPLSEPHSGCNLMVHTRNFPGILFQIKQFQDQVCKNWKEVAHDEEDNAQPNQNPVHKDYTVQIDENRWQDYD